MEFKTLLLLFSLILSFVTFAEAKQCCQDGEYALRGNLSCWDQDTNVKTPLNLPCNNYIALKSGYSVDKAGMLSLGLEGYEVPQEEYCFANATTLVGNNLTRTRDVVIICVEEEEEAIVDEAVMGYCMMVSVIFLTFSVIIYASFSELRDLQGKSIINFCGSLAIGLAVLAIMKTFPYSDMNLCAARGYFAYFFIMACFFWTTAISIQILRSTRNPLSIGEYGWRDFKWYALFAWGCPFILTVCVIVANYAPGQHWRPGIGLSHCWFYTKDEQWYYMYSIMTVLLTTNFIIFIYTSTIIWRTKFSSQQLKAIRYKFTMTIRLIVVMGIPWIFEMVSSLMGEHVILSIIDVFNGLQGILIFLVLVVFRKRVIKVLYKRGWLDCISGPVERYLAVAKDDEDNVIQQTEVPMSDKA